MSCESEGPGMLLYWMHLSRDWVGILLIALCFVELALSFDQMIFHNPIYIFDNLLQIAWRIEMEVLVEHVWASL